MTNVKKCLWVAPSNGASDEEEDDCGSLVTDDKRAASVVEWWDRSCRNETTDVKVSNIDNHTADR
jgi:hypothetical protein